MRHSFLAIAAAASLIAPSVASAQQPSYAEDRALIENMSNHYMVAVDAGDIDTVMDTWAEDGVLNWVGGDDRHHVVVGHVLDQRPILGIAGLLGRGGTRHRCERQRGNRQERVSQYPLLSSKGPPLDGGPEKFSSTARLVR